MSETTPPDPWLAAERAADLHRYQRLHPTARYRFAERRLRPLIIVLLILDSAALLTAVWLPDDLRDEVRFAGVVGILLTGTAAFIWGSRTDRLALAGSPSIRASLPAGTWPAVRQQIIGNHALDPEHSDTITEIAHQHRAQQQGQLALFSYLVLMYLYIGTSHDALGTVLLVIGTVALGYGAFAGIRTDRRLLRFITEHDSQPVSRLQ